MVTKNFAVPNITVFTVELKMSFIHFPIRTDEKMCYGAAHIQALTP